MIKVPDWVLVVGVTEQLKAGQLRAVAVTINYRSPVFSE
jgi:hypothetical protein